MPLVTEDTIRSLTGPNLKKIILPFARGRTPKSLLAAWSTGLRWLRGRAAAAGGGSGPGASRCPGEAEARVQSRKQLPEATQHARSWEAQPSGSGPAGPWSHCLSPRPSLGPAGFGFCCSPCCCNCPPRSWARARPKPRRPTGFGCPANAKVKGRGPPGVSCRRGRAYGARSGGARCCCLPSGSLHSLHLLCAWLCAGRWGHGAGRQIRSRCTWSSQIGKTKNKQTSNQLSSRIVGAVIDEVQGFGGPVRTTSPASH